MRSIEFTATFGDKKRRIKLSLPSGGGLWQVLIDNYLQGHLEKRDGKWISHLNDRVMLTADDIQILGEMIDKENEERK